VPPLHDQTLQLIRLARFPKSAMAFSDFGSSLRSALRRTGHNQALAPGHQHAVCHSNPVHDVMSAHFRIDLRYSFSASTAAFTKNDMSRACAVFGSDVS